MDRIGQNKKNEWTEKACRKLTLTYLSLVDRSHDLYITSNPINQLRQLSLYAIRLVQQRNNEDVRISYLAPYQG